MATTPAYILSIMFANLLSGEPVQILEVKPDSASCLAAVVSVTDALKNANRVVSAGCQVMQPPSPEKPANRERQAQND
jgi:predicted enzyme related to lactoylglutathione lyase